MFFEWKLLSRLHQISVTTWVQKMFWKNLKMCWSALIPRSLGVSGGRHGTKMLEQVIISILRGTNGNFLFVTEGRYKCRTWIHLLWWWSVWGNMVMDWRVGIVDPVWTNTSIVVQESEDWHLCVWGGWKPADQLNWCHRIC